MPSAPDAILLCGGAGTRLRNIIGGAPKSLATIGGRPFIHLLLHQLRRHGFQRVILAVGYHRELIRSHMGDQAYGLAIEYSIESTPLGTGGALRNAVDFITSDSVLIMNGDSYTDGDLHAFAEDYRAAKADMSVLVVPADGRLDCGLVSVDTSRKVLGFKEKQTSAGTFHVNAGIYIAAKQLLRDVPPGLRLSLEEELFPRWLAEGKYIRAFSHAGCCVDIGTPERYQSAQEMLANVEIGQTFSYPQSKRAQSHGYQDRDEPCEPEEYRNFGTTMKAQQNTKQLHNLIRTRIERAIEIKSVLLADSGYHALVASVAIQIVKSLGAGGKVLFFGNGGSAADAQHLAAEFTGRYLKERRALPALALHTNTSSLTAIGNDYGFDFIFARQLEALGKAGDVAVGISTSGNSRNVLRALEAAKAKSIYTVALTGGSGGAIKNLADCAICIPSEETPRIQECHILTGHLICEIVEEMLFESHGA